MSKSEFDTHLKYGQGILIQGYKEKNHDLGFLTAKGFADIKAKYETYDNILYFKNYRNAIFQMLPAGNFELNDELHKAKIDNEGKEETPNIKILTARAKSEMDQFNLNIENKNKNLVCFGNLVIFKHIDSETYISGTIRPSAGSNGAFTVEVSNNLSESLIFKLLPYRSFEFLGMPIPFDSPIILKNEFNNGFLTFEKLGLGDGSNERGMYIEKKPIESDGSYKIPVKTQSQVSDVYECVTHFVDLSVEKQVPMPWKFVLHFNDVDNDSLIQHDIVYLEHTENKGVLSMQGGKIILKEMKEPPQSSELKFYECLWQIEKHDSTEDAYILRHLMSGQTLGIEYQKQIDEDGKVVVDENGEEVTIPSHPILIDISGGQEKTEFGVVELKLAKKQGGIINSDSHINVAWGDFILETEEDEADELNEESEVKSEEIISPERMKKLLRQSVEFTTRKLKFRQDQAQKHCFVIQEIHDDLKKDVLFALSFHSVIINLREDLKWGAIEAAKKVDYFRMMKVTEKIREIKDFLKNCSREDADLEHILPVEKCQMICKDLGISELLFELLFYMKMNIKEDIFSDKHNERDKFVELYNTLYEVITELIRGNRLFKMHISKWIMFIFEDVINSNESDHLNMLKELLQDNEFFVQNFVTEKLLKYLTDSMLDRLHDSPFFNEKKYLEIMRLFCITGSTVNTGNQVKIYNTFIKALYSERGSALNFRIFEKDEKILIKASIDKSVVQEYTFKGFQMKAAETNTTAWDFFVEYLNLIADMTQGRNKVTENELAKEFTLKILTTIFDEEDLAESEVPVLRILHYLYAESEIYYPVERHKLLVDYNSLNEDFEPQIVTTPSQHKPWQPPFEKVLEVLLRKVKQCGEIDPSDFKNNKTTYELLNFTWQTINLGFWPHKENVKQILNSILRILSKHENITNYEDVKKKSAQNILMIKCKLECLKIISLIADYDEDLFVQRLAYNFKGFEMPQKKRCLQREEMGSLLALKTDNEISSRFIDTIPDENETQPLVETNICDQMFELSNYGNPQLTSMALSVIERILQTKKKAIGHFSSQKLLCEQDTLEFKEYINSVRNSLFTLEDPNLVHINEQSQRDNYFLVYEPGKRDNLMAILYNLSELMKNENDIKNLDKMKSLEESGIYEYLGGEKLINFTMERSSTSQIKQNIVFCSNLHQKVLTFIFNCKEIPEEVLAKKLLHLCYKFIVSLIENYNEIKVMMVKEIPKMIHQISQNVGCVDFLKEMYDNNKNMLYNESQVFELIKFMCDAIEKENRDSYYKSKLLDFFRYLIYCNGKSLKFIQIQILKIMQDDTYKNIMLKKEDLERLPELVDEYVKANASKKPGELIEMSAELTYMMTFFQISASLIDDNNSVNMGKVIKKFPFDHLVGYIRQSKTCWPLKRNIRTLLNRLYYFQPEVETYLKCIIEEDFQNIIDDLNTYIELKHQPNALQCEGLMFESPVRFSYLESYVYLNLQENFFTIFQFTTRDSCITDALAAFEVPSNERDTDGDELYGSAYKFIKVSERLAWIRTFFTDNRNVYSNSMLKFILMKIKNILLKLSPAIYVKKKDESKDQIIEKIISAEGIDKFFKEKSSKVTGPIPLSYYVAPHKQQIKKEVAGDRQRLLNKLRKILKREKREFENEDEKNSYYMNKLINSLKLSTKVEDFFFEEFQTKVSTYSRRDDIYDYISTIIQMNSEYPEAMPNHLKSFFLELITFLVQQSNEKVEPEAQEGEENPQNLDQEAGEQMVEEESQKAPLVDALEDLKQEEIQEEAEQSARTPIDKWQAEEWADQSDQIKSTQNRLKECQLSKFIIDLLKENITENIAFANSILLCAISYLLGGNSQSQKSMIDELKADEDNKVFLNIEELIDNLGKLILKNITENNEIQEDENIFHPTTIDNYDYFDAEQRYCCRKNVFEPNSTDEFIYNRLCITTYRRAFKFLQLLCESNNIEGKHFIREQEGKSRKVNFINVTTKELRNLFQVMCYEIIDVPIFLLDFILEVTQIPVKENQDALMRSTFFEDLCQMEDTFNKPGILELRGIKNRDQIDEIFFKSVEIILSNFEGNSEKTFLSLDSKLESKFLTNILARKLKQFHKANKPKELDENGEQIEEEGQVPLPAKSEFVAHIKAFTNEEDQEGSKNTTFPEEVMQALNIIIIFKKMNDKLKGKSRIYNSYEKFKAEEHTKFQEQVQGELIDKYGSEENPEYKEVLEERMAEFECLFTHLEKCVLHIEITDNNNEEQTVYFPNYPVFKSLSGGLRDYVMNEVERATHRDKIVSLLGFVNGVKEKIEYSYNLQKKERITERNMNSSYNIAAFISILICGYMMLSYEVIVEYGKAQFTSPYHIGIWKFLLSLLQLFFSLLYTYYWARLRIWYKPQRESRGGEEGAPTSGDDEENAQAGQEEEVDQNSLKSKIFGYCSSGKQFVVEKITKLLGKLSIETESFQSGEFWRIAIFVLCSFLGTFYYPVLFFIHLIDIFCKIEVLANIFEAVAVNIKSLLYVSFMGVVFVFVFCTVTFSNYMKNVYSEGESVDEMCDDMLDCVMSLYVSGAITETMEVFELQRFTFDMIYLTFFGLLFGNIVQGIMLDAFAGLREKNEELTNDKKNTCYICNMPRELMEKKGEKFKDHTEQTHFLWNYVFYIISLERKNETDYTGLEYEISQKYNRPDEEMDVSWVPSKGESEFDIAEQAAQLTEKVMADNQLIEEKGKELESRIDEFNVLSETYQA